MSMPRVRAAACARVSGACPTCQSPRPAESISKRSSTSSSWATRRNTPSAMGARQILPRQANRRRCLAMPPEMALRLRPHKMSQGAASAGSCSTRCIHLFSLGIGALAPSREVETMVAWNDAAELRNAALGKEIALSTFADRERKVRRDFWSKLKRFAGMVPFVEDLVAAYYCALDPATPMRVRGMLLAALAYFILPVDLIPDMIAGLG